MDKVYILFGSICNGKLRTLVRSFRKMLNYMKKGKRLILVNSTPALLRAREESETGLELVE